ncbi:transglycosylase domain-containing protein [Actinomadura scrupuli]|uniref:transglycosylase domain-containing protein n=1 Tax=Actinomadura scrupuli TaxID=559629 RepID=UPI003D97DACA
MRLPKALRPVRHRRTRHAAATRHPRRWPWWRALRALRRARFVPTWRAVLGLIALAVLALGTLIGVGYARTPMPTEPQDGVTDQGSPVYYADGTPILRLGAHRELLGHAQIPDRLRWAVLAAEDRGFYGEPGISPRGLARALWNNVTGGDVQGGSTVTQQLARNYYKGLSKDRTAGRKFKEAFIAFKLSRRQTKDEILDLYLNTVYFGRQSSGVQAASRAYFHKDAWNLSVAECALLAAMIQRPAYFKTQGDDEAARALRARWSYVLDGLVGMGRLSRAEAARQRFPATQRQWDEVDESGQLGLMRDRVLQELQQLDIPSSDVVNGGLKIYTGLDKRWMAYAGQAMAEAKVARWPVSLRSGLIAVDPRDGAVRAFYGGDPRRSQVDTVFTPTAQAGSTFKPYVLAAALKQGYSVRSVVDGRSPQKFDAAGNNTPMNTPGYSVSNDEKIGSLGIVDLVEATAQSVNTGYVKLGFQLGLGRVLAVAQEFGVPSSYLTPFRGQGGLSLGIATIPAVHQAAGYAAFANGGTPVTPHVITKIVDAHGRSIPLPWDERAEPVLTREQAAQATYALRAVVTGGTGRRAALPDRPVAGKTGTTDGHRAAWFVGYVPQLATAVLLADNRNRPISGIPGRHEAVDGGSVPAEIWRSFMAKVTRDLPVQDFPAPAFTGELRRWPSTLPGTSSPPPPRAGRSSPRPAVPCKPGRPGCPGSAPSPGLPYCTPDSAPKSCDPDRPPPAGPALKWWCVQPEHQRNPACGRVQARSG